MTTTVTVTGSGTPVPHAQRAGPGVLVDAAGIQLQFDAGRSTVQRLAGAEVSPLELDAFFATHHHSDHLTGLQDLVLSRWNMARGAAINPLDVVVPDGPCHRFVAAMLDLWVDDIEVRRQHAGRTTRPEIDILTFDCDGAIVPVWERGPVRVLAGPVCHQPVDPAVGFRIETPDGVVAVSGDTTVCDEVARLADGADVLVHEAMRFEVVGAGPPERRHITSYHADSRLIGGMAQDCGVSTLILTHLIPAADTPEITRAYEADIRAGGFTGDLIVAADLDRVEIGADS